MTPVRAIKVAAFVFLVGVIGPASAAGVKVGSVTINLPTPKGFCELSSQNPSEKNMLTTTGASVASSGNILLSMAADCQQLAAWDAKQRKVLDDFAEYQTPKSPDSPTETI